jgi:hypothetical protein
MKLSNALLLTLTLTLFFCLEVKEVMAICNNPNCFPPSAGGHDQDCPKYVPPDPPDPPVSPVTPDDIDPPPDPSIPPVPPPVDPPFIPIMIL